MKIRRLAILSAVVLIAASCNLSRSSDRKPQDTGPVKIGGGVVLPKDRTPEPEVATPTPIIRKVGGSKTTPPPKKGATEFKQLPPVSAGGRKLAEQILRSSTRKMVIEVDYVTDADPDQNAVTTYRDILEGVVDKPGGIEIRRDPAIPREHDTYSGEQIDALAKKYRDTQTTDDIVSLYIIYIPGNDGNPVLGYANGRYFVMFPEKIRSTSRPPAISKAVETAILVHETGHLMLLVNLGYTSPRERTDPEDPAQPSHHNRNKKSVMYYSIDTTGVFTLLSGNTTPPINYDADDKADLEDIKNGKL